MKKVLKTKKASRKRDSVYTKSKAAVCKMLIKNRINAEETRSKVNVLLETTVQALGQLVSFS